MVNNNNNNINDLNLPIENNNNNNLPLTLNKNFTFGEKNSAEISQSIKKQMLGLEIKEKIILIIKYIPNLILLINLKLKPTNIISLIK